MGDYFSDDYSKMKAYSRFEMKIDLEEVEKEVFARVEEFLNKDTYDAGGLVMLEANCLPADDPPAVQYLYGSKTKEEILDAFTLQAPVINSEFKAEYDTLFNDID
mmetsp:Transcript_19488/g.33121  ORF Transcript_19488/g.33121 Transcript_19488/m.33121 type:complete len:105 (+) Transcript_19488:888-1202(+)